RKGASDVLPTVITEAMACSLPVVSTRLAGIPELVEHGETGLLVEPGDAHALAEVIAELAIDPARREKLGKAGRVRAEQTFALEKTAALLADRFRTVVSGKTTAPRAKASVVYLMDGSRCARTGWETLSQEPRLRFIACSLNPDSPRDA